MDILSLNETNLNDTIATDSLNIPANYTFLRNDRVTGSRGGCGLIIWQCRLFEVINIVLLRVYSVLMSCSLTWASH